MIRRDEGLVVRTLPYGDTSLIATLFTEQAAAVDFILKGVRAPSRRPRHATWLPLTRLQVVYYDTGREGLRRVNESHALHPAHQLQLNPIKRVYALLLTEVYAQSLRAVPPNPALYRYLCAAVAHLDQLDTGVYVAVLHHLVHLTRYLGFFPTTEVTLEEPLCLDLTSGCFTADPVGSPVDQLLLRLALTRPDHLQGFTVPAAQRAAALGQLLAYYGCHVEGFRPPRSLEVFAQVFSG